MGSGRGDSVTKTGSNGEIISLHGEQVRVRQACSRVIGGWWQAMRRNTSAGPCSGPATWQEMQLCMCPCRPASSPGPSAAWAPIDALLPPQSGCAVALPLPSGLPQVLGKQALCAHLRHCRPSAPSQWTGHPVAVMQFLPMRLPSARTDCSMQSVHIALLQWILVSSSAVQCHGSKSSRAVRRQRSGEPSGS